MLKHQKTILFVDPITIKKWISHNQWTKAQYYLSTIQLNKFRAWEYLLDGFVKRVIFFNLKQSEECFSKATKLGSKDTAFLNVYSELLLKFNEKKQALIIATNSVSLDKNNPSSAVALARIAEVNGQYESAYKAAENAYKTLPLEEIVLKKEMDELMIRHSPLWTTPLVNGNIVLRRVEKKDEDFLYTLRNNKKFQSMYNIFQSSSLESIQKDIEISMESPKLTGRIEWIVEVNNEPVGVAALVGLDWKNLRGEPQLGFINTKRAKDIVKATAMLFDFGFKKIRFQKAVSYVYENNYKSQKYTLNIGFKEEGFLHSHIYDPNTKTRLGLHVYGYLAEDYFKNDRLDKF